MGKSKITDIGHAVLDLIEEYHILKDLDWTHNPVGLALYYTWMKYDVAERKDNEEEKADQY